MSNYPKHLIRKVQPLNGIWEFRFLGDDVELEALRPETMTFDDRMAVPGAFDASPAYAGKRGTALYRTRFRCRPGARGMLRFHGLGMWARVWVDGEQLGDWNIPYSGFSMDVPPSKQVERTLVVAVDNRWDSLRVPTLEQFFDFYAYGGIYRSVEFHELPTCHIQSVQVLPLEEATGKVRIRLQLGGQVPPGIPVSVSWDGGLENSLGTLRPNAGWVEMTMVVPDAKPWSPESPNLHTLQVGLPQDDMIVRFGLRTVAAKGKDLMLNGKALKLKGFCRHEAHPQFGPALPENQMVNDLHQLREMGCNFVRGSHYPQDPRFLDLCDEMGFLVFEETLGWGQGKSHFTNEAFCLDQQRQARAMVRNSINHPSVILWGFLNEGASQLPESRALYESMVGILREEDPTRLVTYATNHPHDDRNLDLVDVVSINIYPGWYAADNEKVRPLEEIEPQIDKCLESMQKHGAGDKPLLISEIGAGAIYGWRDPLNAHWSESYQADYLEIVCRRVIEDERILGVAIWQYCDCRTYASSRALFRPRAFNNKGVVDEYRRPKQAFGTVRGFFRKD